MGVQGPAAWPVVNPIFTAGGLKSFDGLAGPHMWIQEEGRLLLFFEATSCAAGHRSISIAESNDEGISWNNLRSVLSTHSSDSLRRPSLFQYQGQHFMVTDSSKGPNLHLSVRFPMLWHFNATLIDEPLRGVTIFKSPWTAQERYLLTGSIPLHKGDAVTAAGGAAENEDDALAIYVAHSPLGPWRQHSASPFRVAAASPGGGVLPLPGVGLIRLGRSCKRGVCGDVVAHIFNFTGGIVTERAVSFLGERVWRQAVSWDGGGRSEASLLQLPSGRVAALVVGQSMVVHAPPGYVFWAQMALAALLGAATGSGGAVVAILVLRRRQRQRWRSGEKMKPTTGGGGGGRTPSLHYGNTGGSGGKMNSSGALHQNGNSSMQHASELTSNDSPPSYISSSSGGGGVSSSTPSLTTILNRRGSMSATTSLAGSTPTSATRSMPSPHQQQQQQQYFSPLDIEKGSNNATTTTPLSPGGGGGGGNSFITPLPLRHRHHHHHHHQHHHQHQRFHIFFRRLSARLIEATPCQVTFYCIVFILATSLAYSVAKITAILAPFNVPAPSQSLGGQFSRFTLMVMSYDQRRTLLESYVRHYHTCPSVGEILIVWNKGPPPEASIDFPWSNVPVRVRVERENSLNNRYRPDSELRFRGVLSLDDDLRIPCVDVEKAFTAWRTHPDVLTGFFPRLAEVTSGYHSEPETVAIGYYNLILTGAAFIDSRTAFQQYWADEVAGGRALVDSLQNCDDILMNFVVANHTNSTKFAPVYFVRPSRRVDVSWWSGVGLSHAVEHFRADAEQCLGEFGRLFGRWPLKAEQFEWDKPTATAAVVGVNSGGNNVAKKPWCSRSATVMDCSYLS